MRFYIEGYEIDSTDLIFKLNENVLKALYENLKEVVNDPDLDKRFKKSVLQSERSESGYIEI